jgi:hypothetical protein
MLLANGTASNVLILFKNRLSVPQKPYFLVDRRRAAIGRNQIRSSWDTSILCFVPNDRRRSVII